MMWWEILIAGLWLASWILVAAVYGHAVILSFFGVRKWKPSPDTPPRKRFAVVVPAHNEQDVIGPLLEDLANQDYPRELFAVYVLADNCTDGTTEVARAVWGTRVIVRKGESHGKGAAVRAAVQWIWDEAAETGQGSFDAFVFLDADNRISQTFLQKMNNELCEGHVFVQGYLGTKNPFDNWVTRVIYQSYCMTNRLWQLGKRRSGLPSQCGGTGFCIDAEVLRGLGWPMTTVTEDLEMVCILARRGIFPVWAHDAIVYDEKPRSVRVALRQRIRWMRGHFANLFKHFIPLVRAGLKRRDLRILDCALYLLYPVCVLSLAFQSVLWLANQTIFPSLPIIHPGLLPVSLVFAMLTYYPIAGIYLETKSARELAFLPLLFAFNWLWIPACVVALFTCANRRWYHTPHGAALSEGIRL